MKLLVGTHIGDHVIFNVGHADYFNGCDWVPCTLDIAARAFNEAEMGEIVAKMNG